MPPHEGKVPEVFQEYLLGQLEISEAAREIVRQQGERGEPVHMGLDKLSAEQRERAEDLLGYVLWLSLRQANAELTPSTPFGAKEYRQFSSQAYNILDGLRHKPPEESNE